MSFCKLREGEDQEILAAMRAHLLWCDYIHTVIWNTFCKLQITNMVMVQIFIKQIEHRQDLYLMSYVLHNNNN
jgi:hypothetical protein